MTDMHSPTAAAAADRLVTARPEGRLALAPALLEVLYDRIGAAGDVDPALPPAVAAGDEVVRALNAGCPPQFHPGVAPEHAEVLERARRRLGLDRTEALVLDPSTDERFIRVLRALGCTVVPAVDLPDGGGQAPGASPAV
jgi:hypothetical protein